MDQRKLAPLAAAMLLAGLATGDSHPHQREAAPKPKVKSKNRDKVKAARKQRNSRK